MWKDPAGPAFIYPLGLQAPKNVTKQRKCFFIRIKKNVIRENFSFSRAKNILSKRLAFYKKNNENQRENLFLEEKTKMEQKCFFFIEIKTKFVIKGNFCF